MALTLMRLNGTAIREASSGWRAPALCRAQIQPDIYIYIPSFVATRESSSLNNANIVEQDVRLETLRKFVEIK